MKKIQMLFPVIFAVFVSSSARCQSKGTNIQVMTNTSGWSVIGDEKFDKNMPWINVVGKASQPVEAQRFSAIGNPLRAVFTFYKTDDNHALKMSAVHVNVSSIIRYRSNGHIFCYYYTINGREPIAEEYGIPTQAVIGISLWDKDGAGKFEFLSRASSDNPSDQFLNVPAWVNRKE